VFEKMLRNGSSVHRMINANLAWRSHELEDEATRDNLVGLAKCWVYKRAIQHVKMEIRLG
jgi:hypothetical protein